MLGSHIQKPNIQRNNFLPPKKQKEMIQMKCDFCQEECDGRIVLRTTYMEKKDGSDIRICGECLNLYHNQEWDKLSERVKSEGKK